MRLNDVCALPTTCCAGNWSTSCSCEKAYLSSISHDLPDRFVSFAMVSFYWWLSEPYRFCWKRNSIKYATYIYYLCGKQKWFLDPAVYMETWKLTGLCSCWLSKNKILLPVSKSSLYSVTLHALLCRGMILALIEIPPFSWLLSKAAHTYTSHTTRWQTHTHPPTRVNVYTYSHPAVVEINAINIVYFRLSQACVNLVKRRFLRMSLKVASIRGVVGIVEMRWSERLEWLMKCNKAS